MNFDDFHKWVYRELGINLASYKPTQLNRRIDSLMSRIGVKSLEEYTKLIKTNYEERQRFLDFITINVTEFFRNPELFNELEGLLKEKVNKEKRPLKIWSAACSIGCEPYTLAMILKEINPSYKHKILATDIDSTILAKAKAGVYTNVEMKNVKKNIMDKYFTKQEAKYLISPEIKSLVTFKKHDLILDRYESDFDLIVCRNVVIYFKNEVKAEIFKNFSKALRPGGLLFVGATESIYNYKEYDFSKASTFIYRKV
ncbi:protein-glutamate O-methyltransferase CheR [Clostridium sp. LY3-2]|uniref:CheR family methyltransferase n=1 Tax=Clostridium sp. LY3-2 TaxID=2942482 RepID=UPI002153404B|nr:protein-glutamate O-methyltransferase CheR [Clostridium sp. LY3-2]MCR6513601.1 protein-glutamate O-methyltransferase CheR [Clostridium sp. LY3-2]